MKQITKKVRHGKEESGAGKIVAEVELVIYETVQEILDNEPEERILAVFNNGNHVRLMGNERAKFSGTVGGGKKARNVAAFNSLTAEELYAVQGDIEKLNTFLQSPAIQARVDAALAEIAPAETETIEAAE